MRAQSPSLVTALGRWDRVPKFMGFLWRRKRCTPDKPEATMEMIPSLQRLSSLLLTGMELYVDQAGLELTVI